METKKDTRKNYRLDSNLISKIEELKIRKSAELNSRLSETNIIENAIEYYHSHVFGDKAKDLFIQRLENEIHYAVDDALKNFMAEIVAMFQIIQRDILENQLYTEIILKILVSKLEVDTSASALHALTNNQTIFKEEVNNRIKKEQPTIFQYLKILNDAKEKYEIKEKLPEHEEGEIIDENNLPF